MLARTTGPMALLVALIFALGLVAGCNQDGGKKAPAKKAAEKAPAKAPAEKAPVEKAPVEKAPVEKEPADKPPVEKEPVEKEPTPEEPAAPTAAELLEKSRKTNPGITTDMALLTAYFENQTDAMNTYPDTDAAYYAYVDGAKLRLQYIAAGQNTDALLTQIMTWDGAAKAGEAPTAEAKALYYKTLAQEFAAKAEKASKAEDARPLTNGAALLIYLHDQAMEEAGKVPGNELEIPADWKVAPAQPAAGAEAAAPEADAAAPATKEAPAEAVDAKAGTAQAAPAEPVAAPLRVKVQGSDVTTLLALATGDNSATLQARALVLGRLANALDVAGQGPTLYGAWWKTVAVQSGKVLCAACGQLDTVKEAYIDDVLYLSGNQGIVCKGAQAEIASGIAVAEAVAKHCLADLGVSEADAALVTPYNALELRFYALAGQMLNNLPATAKEDPFFAQYEAVAKRVRDQLLKKIALFPVMATFPADQWEAMKDKLVLQNDLTPGAPAWNYMPVEMVVVDELGVGEALRPVADTTTTPMTFADAAQSLRFPGKQVINVEAIATELEARNAKFKEEKRPYDDRLDAYLEEVVIKGVTFKKPDYSIPTVTAAAKALAEKAGGEEAAVFPYLALAAPAIMNHQRPQWPDFPNTVGKATLYAVDQATPALLFKRVVDSLYYADYKETRLVKATGALDTVPTVYFTEKFVADEVLDTTYKRPILVYITDDGTVRFYPPTDKTSKGKMTPTRSPRRRDVKWSGKYRSQEDPRVPDPLWSLFMAYTRADNKNFESDVVGIASEMKKKWDNGNVFYIKAEEKAPSGVVVKVADLLANLPDSDPVVGLDKAFPGYACNATQVADGDAQVWQNTQGCISSIVVLFPDVEIPYLPGKKKVKEVETKVYCDKKDIAAKIAAKKGAIKFCYDPELQKNPNLKGKVIYNFTIGSAGRITEMSVANDGLGNSKVTNCAMNVIKRINFRRPIGGECVIRYPYVFKP